MVGQVAGAMMASSMKADKGNICERTCLFITFVIFFGPPTVGGMIFEDVPGIWSTCFSMRLQNVRVLKQIDRLRYSATKK